MPVPAAWAAYPGPVLYVADAVPWWILMGAPFPSHPSPALGCVPSFAHFCDMMMGSKSAVGSFVPESIPPPVVFYYMVMLTRQVCVCLIAAFVRQ